MLISIVIPVYNVASYIEQCIHSVMIQTMTEGVECIIVDDCGQDNSMEIVERMLACYKGNITFSVIHHQNNRGLSAARNTGINAASGKYIYFLDGDDMIVPECFEVIIDKVKEYPDSQIIFAGAVATAGNYKWLDYTQKQLPEYSNDCGWLQLSILKRFDFGMTAWNKLVLREFVTNNKLYFVEGLIHEDEVWNFDISKYIKTASFVKYNTYIYNERRNSIVTNATEELRWKRLFALWKVLISKLSENKKDLQIRAISEYVLEKTRWKFPFSHRISLCLLFWKLGFKSKNLLSIFLFMQGILALCFPCKYSNRYTCSRIEL